MKTIKAIAWILFGFDCLMAAIMAIGFMFKKEKFAEWWINTYIKIWKKLS